MIITKVYDALMHLKKTGTLRLDGLNGKILKLSASLISDTLTYVYNLFVQKMLHSGCFQAGQSHSSVYLERAQVCQTMGQLSVLSKPFEKYINKHVLAHFNKNNLLHPDQSGFRENHLCHTTLTTLVDQWLSSIDHSHST